MLYFTACSCLRISRFWWDSLLSSAFLTVHSSEFTWQQGCWRNTRIVKANCLCEFARALFCALIVARIFDLLLYSLILICVFFLLHILAVIWYQLVEVKFIVLFLYFVSNLGSTPNRIFSKTTTITYTFNWKWHTITTIEAAVPSQLNGKSVAQQILLSD